MVQEKRDYEKNSVRKVVLKKDIVIPAGTVFSKAPRKVEMCSDYVETIIGLTKNTHMSIFQDVDFGIEEISEWFEEVEK